MNKALTYCYSHVDKEETPKYVQKQMRAFIDVCEDKHPDYIINKEKVQIIESILQVLIMPKGLKAGQTLYECSTGYQWLIYIAVLCTVYRNNPTKRRYETCVLEICRKNFKTYTIATIFIILLLTEPRFSKFYSVAPDGSLSREIRSAIAETLRSSPMIYGEDVKRFRILNDKVISHLTDSEYVPLSYSTSRMDGRMPTAYIADEVGALPIAYPIEAMQSGQVNVKNKLGFIISTKYPTIDNPFEDEVAYAKKVLDGVVENDTYFSLLYEPDTTKGWETNDLILKQANPVCEEVPEIWGELLKKRDRAINMPSARENFVTKHCNIIYQGVGTETYIDIKNLQKCRGEIDWHGKTVYLGVDLSQTTDNTAVAMVAYEDNKILADVFAFIPEGSITKKTLEEKVNYRELLGEHVFACGDKVIDYGYVEKFILDIEQKFGVTVASIGYDRWNAMSTAQKLEREGYETVEIRQHSSVLHPATKFLKEKILTEQMCYNENKLLEINFQNARCVEDANKNLYVNKKKSTGKVDMVVALLNAVYLMHQDRVLNQADFIVQTF